MLMTERNLAYFSLIGSTETEREEIDVILQDTRESAGDGFIK
ncbi:MULTISPECIES: hypothetical protein [Enterobacteriaceae]|jgi:hypothetical protein|nr:MULTISPECIES: hypothetical protein [Enterobacteriaceae]MDT7125543.1 hypothetical protein [Citrobacter freundii]MDT7139677.1 hypothetical protein [Citrobacter freundii]MDT7146739.1 hypothetical protein [Citrobacter freundii]MDT7149199.1 hypothetical protein [Citrobacter freundii]MDT7154841.1 hypothetical protein [Citrobacter freundii]